MTGSRYLPKISASLSCPVSPARVVAPGRSAAGKLSRRRRCVAQDAQSASSAPDWTKWRSNGSQRDEEVAAEFLQAPDVMHRIAQDLRQKAINDTPDNFSKFVFDEDESVLEGRYLLRFHAARERNRGLRQRKIRSVLARGGVLACEACQFDFGQIYGDRGLGYIECHHVEPLHETGERSTSINDLALLCSNCHRMIHRKPPWPTPAQLHEIIKAQASYYSEKRI